MATPVVIGVISGGVKKGLILGFLIPLAMMIIEAIVLQPGAFSDINVVLAIFVMMALPIAGLSLGLGGWEVSSADECSKRKRNRPKTNRNDAFSYANSRKYPDQRLPDHLSELAQSFWKVYV